MYTGNFDIDFICKVPKHGYEWKDNSIDLIPKRNTGVINKQYTQEAYDDFRRLAQYKTPNTDFKVNMDETLRFANKWGNPFSSSANDINFGVPFHAEMIFLEAITLYRLLLRNILNEVVPKEPEQFIPPMMNISFGWDSHGDKIVPIYKPNCLWDAIRFTMLFSMNTKETSKICARKECGKTFSGRSNKKCCSEYCTKKRWEDKNRPPKKSQTNT